MKLSLYILYRHVAKWLLRTKAVCKLRNAFLKCFLLTPMSRNSCALLFSIRRSTPGSNAIIGVLILQKSMQYSASLRVPSLQTSLSRSKFNEINSPSGILPPYTCGSWVGDSGGGVLVGLGEGGLGVGVLLLLPLLFLLFLRLRPTEHVLLGRVGFNTKGTILLTIMPHILRLKVAGIAPVHQLVLTLLGNTTFHAILEANTSFRFFHGYSRVLRWCRGLGWDVLVDLGLGLAGHQRSIAAGATPQSG